MSSITKRVKADGKVMIKEHCEVGQEVQKGEMCGSPGGKGLIYLTKMETDD